MSADSIILEALSRIEHKQDLILEIIARTIGTGTSFILMPVGDKHHVCPVCTENVRYTVNIIDAVVARGCGCRTGKTAIDLKSFAPPEIKKRDNNEYGQDGENGNDSGSGRGLR